MSTPMHGPGPLRARRAAAYVKGSEHVLLYYYYYYCCLSKYAYVWSRLLFAKSRLTMASKSTVSSCEEYHFVESPLQDYFCPVTFALLLEPYQTRCCGNHLSQEAYQRLQGQPCPVCKEDNLTAMRDKYHKRRVLSLMVRCPHKAEGCEWEGELGSLEQHLNTTSVGGGCQYVAVECPYSCNEHVQKRNLEEHKSQHCPLRPFACQYCNHEGTYHEVTKEHWPVCEKFPLPCPNECGEQIERQHLKGHLEQTCPLEVIQCEYSYAGCGAQLQRRLMSAHMKENMEAHLLLMTQEVPKLQKRNCQLEACIKQQGEQIKQQGQDRDKIKQQADQIKQQEDKVKQQGDKIKQQGDQIKKQVDQIKQQGDQIKQQEQQGDQIKQQGDQIKQQGDLIKQQGDQIKQQADKIKQQADKIKQQGDLIKQQGDLIKQQGDQIKQQEDKIKQQGDQIKQQEDKVKQQGDKIKQQEDQIKQQGDQIKQQGDQIKQQGDQIKQQADKIKQQADKIKQQGDLIKQQGDLIKQQGDLIKQQGDKMKQQADKIKQQLKQWEFLIEQIRKQLICIPDPPVDIVMDELRKHKGTADVWYSPPFYSHLGGYKMCLKVHANGYGDGKGTHVSVFVRLMKGVFDDTLKWPFCGDVTVQLRQIQCVHLNRTHVRVISMNRSNLVEPRQRPIGERNEIGLGIDCYISHTEIHLGGFNYCNILNFCVSEVTLF